MQALQPSSVQVTYLHTPTFGQGKVSEQCGLLEKFVMAKDAFTLTTEFLSLPIIICWLNSRRSQ